MGLYLEFTNKKQTAKEEYDLDIFKGSSIISFEEKNIKNNLESYSELNKLFRLFKELQDNKNKIQTKKIDALPLLDFLTKKGSIGKFDCLLTLFANGANINQEDSDKILYQNFIETFLSFKPLHSYYFKFQFNLFTLQNMDEKKHPFVLPKSLKDFEDTYIKFTQGDDSEDLLIHKLCYIVGKEIGRFLGNTDNKDLIFVLRAVNNKEQLVSFLRDFRFKHLKEEGDEDGDEGFKFSKDFHPSFDALLNIVANNKKIFLIRDYLALYVISGYSTGQYYKNKKE
ncbi:hypothetical protein GF362_05430 [Candidatus Dojkabacteria bacterium]|nr:hypothetical protein [Candidatus Dojkabacteria bacterium]